MTLQNSCCAGLDAVGYAANAVASGEAELAICGGTEAPLHRCPILELRAAGLTPPTTEMPELFARPFDLWRTTGVVSEGACMFVLEPEESPRPGYCYVSGYGFANDSPFSECSGISESARLALASANVRATDVDLISAWGPGHLTIDLGEAGALKDVFGALLNTIPTFSIKGAIGSALGAAPAIQIAAAALAIRFGVLPPTVNWTRPDPSCPLGLASKRRHLESKVALVNAHGVGGVNSCMILRQC
jgi:3-oxoacyl-(acyl-carrier-protein) synthase